MFERLNIFRLIYIGWNYIVLDLIIMVLPYFRMPEGDIKCGTSNYGSTNRLNIFDTSKIILATQINRMKLFKILLSIATSVLYYIKSPYYNNR